MRCVKEDHRCLLNFPKPRTPLARGLPFSVKVPYSEIDLDRAVFQLLLCFNQVGTRPIPESL